MTISIIFSLLLCAKVSGSHRATPVHRRQIEEIIPTQCTSQCSPLAQAFSLCVDDSCLCPTLVSAGPPCTSCIAPYNSYEASVLGAGIGVCQTETLMQSPCYSQCARITRAAWLCLDDACYCPILVADGPQCSQCLVSQNDASDAGFYGMQITACRSELATMPTATQTSLPPVNPCGPYCNAVNQAAATCTDDECLCPIIITQGAVCSECWATINPAEANFVASYVSICQSEGLW